MKNNTQHTSTSVELLRKASVNKDTHIQRRLAPIPSVDELVKLSTFTSFNNSSAHCIKCSNVSTSLCIKYIICIKAPIVSSIPNVSTIPNVLTIPSVQLSPVYLIPKVLRISSIPSSVSNVSSITNTASSVSLTQDNLASSLTNTQFSEMTRFALAKMGELDTNPSHNLKTNVSECFDRNVSYEKRLKEKESNKFLGVNLSDVTFTDGEKTGCVLMIHGYKFRYKSKRQSGDGSVKYYSCAGNCGTLSPVL